MARKSALASIGSNGYIVLQWDRAFDGAEMQYEKRSLRRNRTG